MGGRGNEITVSDPKRKVHLSIRRVTRAGTCLEAAASALSASAGFKTAADWRLVALLLLLLLLLVLLMPAGCDSGLQLAHSRLGPTHTARFDADIMFCDELLAMCAMTHRKWRSRHTLALGKRSHNLQ